MILGDAFLRSYYSIYDFENYRMGIAVNSYSSSYVQYGNDKGLAGWAIALIVLACIFVVGVVMAIIFNVYKKKRLREAGRGQYAQVSRT